MLKITHTILDGNCGDLSKSEIKEYGEAVNKAIKTAYPDANVSTEIKWNTSGIGGGMDVRESDGVYEVAPGEGEHDCEAIEAHCWDIADKCLETAGA